MIKQKFSGVIKQNVLQFTEITVIIQLIKYILGIKDDMSEPSVICRFGSCGPKIKVLWTKEFEPNKIVLETIFMSTKLPARL